MKKLIALIVLVTAAQAHCVFDSIRTAVQNNSQKDVWMSWGGAQLKTKSAYYHLKPNGDVFTTTHYTSDKIKFRYYECVGGTAVQKEIEYELKQRKSNLVIQDSGKGLAIS